MTAGKKLTKPPNYDTKTFIPLISWLSVEGARSAVIPVLRPPIAKRFWPEGRGFRLKCRKEKK